MKYVLFESYACIPPTTIITDSEHIPILYTEIEKRIKTLKQRNWNSILELFQILLLGVSWSTPFFILSMHIEVLNICSLGLDSCTKIVYPLALVSSTIILLTGIIRSSVRRLNLLVENRCVKCVNVRWLLLFHTRL
jgi:di/tricarboxylate transporter